MARRRIMRDGRTGLKSTRVAWLPVPINAMKGTLSSGNTNDEQTIFDFGSAAKYADNYGGGDWTVVRLIGSFAISQFTAATASPGLVKVCLGVGMINTRTSVQDSAVSGIVSPIGFPELSWMVHVCCYINFSNPSIERCTFDLKSQRIISERTIMAIAVYTEPVIVDATLELDWNADVRTLVRQRGSRL